MGKIKRHIFNIALLLIPFLVLSGCSEKGSEYSEIAGRTLIDFSDLVSDMDTCFSKSHNQFILSKNCNITKPSALYNCSFLTKKDFSENYADVFNNLAGITELDLQKLKSGKDYMGDVYVYDDEDTNAYACVSGSGFVSFFKGEMYHSDFSSYPIKALFVNGSDEWNESIPGFGSNKESYSVRHAAETAENWINEKWKQYEPDFDFKASHIFVLQGESSRIIAVKVDKYYDGVKLCSCDKQLMLRPETSDPSQVRNSQMTVFINEKNEIIAFSTGTSSLSVSNAESISKCISLSRAFEIIEDTFSEYNKKEIVSVSLKYKLTYKTDIGNNDATDENVLNTTVPVWEFLIVPDHPDFEKSSYTSCSNFLYINVNAETEEIDFVLSSTERQMGV